MNHQLTKTESRGWAFPIGWALLTATCVLYGVAILAYSPKGRPITYTGGVQISWSTLFLGWTLLTLLCFTGLVFHRRLRALLLGLPILGGKWRELIFAGVATAICVGLMEGVLRLSDPFGISTFPEVLRSYDELMIPDSVLRYRQRPGGSGIFHNVEIRLNSAGMRDDEPFTVPPGKRILLIGDSISYGIGVRQEEMAFTLLEDELGGRDRVDVVNTSTQSYNTVQEWKLLQQIGDRYSPDLVLLLYVDNGIWTDDTRPFYPVSYWSQAVFLPRNLLKFSYVRHLLAFARRSMLPMDRGQYLTPATEAGWQRSREALLGIQGWCRERDIPFVVFFYPMIQPDASRPFLGRLEETGREAGFPVIDTMTFLASYGPEKLYRSAADSHLSPLGNRLLSQGIAKYVKEHHPNLLASVQEGRRRAAGKVPFSR